MRYRVWVQRRTLSMENFVVDAENEKDAAKRAIREAERCPVWEKPHVQLKLTEIETIKPKTEKKRQAA